MYELIPFAVLIFCSIMLARNFIVSRASNIERKAAYSRGTEMLNKATTEGTIMQLSKDDLMKNWSGSDYILNHWFLLMLDLTRWRHKDFLPKEYHDQK